jgi:hypothetical protein
MNMENMFSPQERPFRRWFLGMEQISERPINGSELDVLKKRIRTLRMWPFLFMAAILISDILIFFVSMRSDANMVGAILAAFTLLLIGLPPWMFVSRNLLRDMKLLKRDMEFARVFTFEGTVAAPQRQIKIMRRLIRKRLIYEEVDVGQQFELLPCSGTILRINGTLPGAWFTGTIYESTASPKDQYEAFVKQDALESDSGQAIDLFQRHMSQVELEELSVHAKKFRKPPGILIIMAVWLLILAAAPLIHLFTGRFQEWFYVYSTQVIFVCLVAGTATRRYLHMRKTASLLSQDAGTMVLMVLRSRLETEIHVEEKIPPVLEYLPISRMGWNSYGKPYAWRLRESSFFWGKRFR